MALPCLFDTLILAVVFGEAMFFKMLFQALAVVIFLAGRGVSLTSQLANNTAWHPLSFELGGSSAMSESVALAME